MRLRWKVALGAWIGGMMLMGAAVPAAAAQPIAQVDLDIASEDELYDMAPGEVREGIEPYAPYGDEYWISDFTYSGNSGVPKDSYTYTIYVEAQNGYYFTNDTAVTVRGAYEADMYLRSTRRMRIRAKAYPFYVLKTVENISIDRTGTKKATWNPVDYAKNYSVYVSYTTANGSERSVKKTVSKPEIDLSTYLNNEKYSDVQISVMAQRGSTVADRYIAESYYVFEGGSEDYEHSPEEIRFRILEATDGGEVPGTSGSTGSGGNSSGGPGASGTGGNYSGGPGASGPGANSSGVPGANGPGGGPTFTPGSAGFTGWQGGGNSWCYYQNGIRATGWLALTPEEWYYLDGNGNMQAGWFNDNGVIYLLNTNHDGTYGKMLTGLQFYNGNWYYFNEQHEGYYGAMNRNLPVGYWIDSNGAVHW